MILDFEIVYKQSKAKMIKSVSVSSASSLGILCLLLAFCHGNSSCDFEPCLDTYNNLKSLYDTYRDQDITKISSTVINSICSTQNELKDCTKKQSKSCRGDLNYHFFVRLAQRIQTENFRLGNNCSEATGSTSISGSSGSAHAHHNNHHAHGGHSSRRAYASRCNPKVDPLEPTVGCALYGLTNLKSFSDPLNFTDVPYCSLSGAWSLIDLDSVAVQITNKGGLSPLPKDITTTTLVTVIVKNNECAERKTYQATFDEVPAMFSDGSSTAGTVYIEQVTRSEHVRIHFPYDSTVVEIIRVIGHLPISTLSVTIRMPERNASTVSTTLNRATKGIPLCFYGCPKTANIKPRSIDPTHRCPAPSEGDDDDDVDPESPSTEFMNTANSITSAICDSLANVQNILKETSVLENRLRLAGEDNFVTTQSDSIVSTGLPPPSSQQRHQTNNNSKFLTNSAHVRTLSSVSLQFSLIVLISLYINR